MEGYEPLMVSLPVFKLDYLLLQLVFGLVDNRAGVGTFGSGPQDLAGELKVYLRVVNVAVLVVFGGARRYDPGLNGLRIELGHELVE